MPHETRPRREPTSLTRGRKPSPDSGLPSSDELGADGVVMDGLVPVDGQASASEPPTNGREDVGSPRPVYRPIREGDRTPTLRDRIHRERDK